MTTTANDLKKGTVFKVDDRLYISLDWQHKVSGRGSALIVVKARNLANGQISQKSWRSQEEVELINIQKKTAQFLYKDQKYSYWLDPQNYQQYHLSLDQIGHQVNYLTDNLKVILLIRNDQPIGLELPKNVSLEVIETEAVVRGDTSGSLTKNATLAGGLTIKVPGFIKTGDLVVVDSHSGLYRERQKPDH